MVLDTKESVHVNFIGIDVWKRVNLTKSKKLSAGLIAAAGDCFMAVPEENAGMVFLISSDSRTIGKKQIAADLLDLDARLVEQSGLVAKKVLAIAGSSSRLVFCVNLTIPDEEDLDSKNSTSNDGKADGKPPAAKRARS